MPVANTNFSQKKPDQLVYIELGPGNGGMLLSLSEDGLRFRAVAPVRVSGPVPFAFALDGSHRLEGLGTIEWLEGDGKSGGLRFTEVADEFRSAITTFLGATSSPQTSGREVTSAAETPQDTMESIRKELRAGYPPRPSDVHPMPGSSSNAQKTPAAEPPAPRRAKPSSAPQVQQKTPAQKPASATSGSGIAGRLFSQPAPSEPGSDRPSANASAFLKSVREAPETKSHDSRIREVRPSEGDTLQTKPSSAVSRPPAAPVFSALFGTRVTPSVHHEPESESSQEHSAPLLKPLRKEPDRTAGKAESRTEENPRERAPDEPQEKQQNRVQEKPDERLALRGAAQQEKVVPVPVVLPPRRPYIPPVDDYDEAWKRAQLVPEENPPHLSRAAAGSIIALALFAILGALIYNFRQDIGGLFIEMGRSISGSSQSSAQPPSSDAQSQDASSGVGSTNGATDAAAAANPSPTASHGNAPAAAPGNSTNRVNNTTGTKSGHALPNGGQSSGSESANTQNANTVGSVTQSQGAAPTSNGAVPATADAPSAKPGDQQPQKPADATPAQTAATQPNTPGKTGYVVEGGNGAEEFSAAREILKGGNRRRDLRVAIELLWSSVRKGYVPAEVTLADLYRRGDGVEKNCEQASILLTAASKKGSFEARQILEYIAEHGCE